MFGYVKINKPEMKVKEYEAYRGIYCSLCRALKKHFGTIAAMTLSYDLTFLALIRLSFGGKLPDFRSGRCRYNPSKKCSYCVNGDEELKYAAAVSVMMVYFRIKDNIADGSFFRRMLMYLILPLAAVKYKKAKRMYGEIALMLEKNIENQAQAEKSQTDSTDIAAHASADMLGRIVAYGFDDKEGRLYRFGYAVGKWVYLCDAADDIEKDIKRNNYNVFVKKYNLLNPDLPEQAKQEITGSLNLSLAMADEVYDDIENKTMKPIIENIIYDGMFNVMNNILKGNDENERSL